jgi:hypothetical protein
MVGFVFTKYAKAASPAQLKIKFSDTTSSTIFANDFNEPISQHHASRFNQTSVDY